MELVQQDVSKLLKKCTGQDEDFKVEFDNIAPSKFFGTKFREVTDWVVRLFQIEQFSDYETFERSVGKDFAEQLIKFEAIQRAITHLPKEHKQQLDVVEEEEERLARDKGLKACQEGIAKCRLLFLHARSLLISANFIARFLHDSDDAILPLPLYFFSSEKMHMERHRDESGQPAAEDAGSSGGKGRKGKGQHSEQDQTELEYVVRQCLDEAMAYGYRTLNGIVYEEFKVMIDGKLYFTKYFKPVNNSPDGQGRQEDMTVDNLIGKICTQERDKRLWNFIIKWQNRSNVERRLCQGEDPEFPKLRRDRRYIAFANGVYKTYDRYSRGGIFYSYGEGTERMSPLITCCRFIEQIFDAETWFGIAWTAQGSWFNIPTPHFQSILDYQNYGYSLKNRQAPPTDGDAVQAEQLRKIRIQLLNFQTCFEEKLVEAEQAIETTRALSKSSLSALSDTCKAFQNNIEKLAAATEAEGEGDAHESFQHRRLEEAPIDIAGPDTTRRQISTKAVALRPVPGKGLPVEVQRWIYIFMGRMLHDLGTVLSEHWQIMPFFKGVAGTGKSLIAEIVMKFFELCDIGIISSKIENVFGIGQLSEKFIGVCSEMKRDFSLPQAVFQQIISGEAVSLARKNRDATQIEWRLPLLMCGNEWAAYEDSQGSITRRLAIINFRFPVAPCDSRPTLRDDILNNELAALIFKCNFAYQEMAEYNQGRSIWDILPEYFRHQTRSLVSDTNPLMALLRDETTYEPCVDGYVSLTSFQQEYRAKCKQMRGNDYMGFMLTDDKLAAALQEFDARMVIDVRPDPAFGGEARRDKWIVGIRSVRDSGISERFARAAG